MSNEIPEHLPIRAEAARARQRAGLPPLPRRSPDEGIVMLVIRHPWIPSLVGFLVAFGLVPIGAPVGVAVAVGIGWAALAWFIATGIRRRMHPIIQERRP